MTSRELLEIKSGLASPLWRYIQDYAAKQVIELRAEASRYGIVGLTDVMIREQMLMRANSLESLIEALPSQINAEYKEKLQLEEKTHE